MELIVTHDAAEAGRAGRPTPRQLAIYAWIFAETLRHGYQPSLRELMAEFGIASTNGAVATLKSLERKGWLATTGESRALRFLRLPTGEPFRGLVPAPAGKAAGEVPR